MANQSASIGPWEIAFQDFMTPVGLVVSAVRLWGDGAALQTEPFTYTLQNDARVQALIHQASLEAFIKTNLPDNMSDVSVTLKPGKVVVKGKVKVILPVGVTATCTLRVVEGTKVYVDLETVEMLGAGVKTLVQKQIDAINPVLDTADWPVDVNLDEVRVEKGRVVAEGTVVPPPLG